MKSKSVISLVSASILLSVGATAIARQIRIPIPSERLSADRSTTSTPTRLSDANSTVRNDGCKTRSEDEAKVFDLPFFDNFQDGDAAKANYTVIDADNDGITYSESSITNKWFWKADESLMQFCIDQENPVPGNDWLMTPGIHLDGKTTYRLTILVNMGAPSNLRATVGKSLDPADHTTEIFDLKNITCSGWYDTYSEEFTVDGEGVYHIGLYNYTSESGFYLNLFQIELEAGESMGLIVAPADLTVSPAENGTESATVAFTVPDRKMDGSLINGDVDMVIKRDHIVIGNMACAPGSRVELTDSDVASGEHTYTVYGKYEGEEGKTASTTVWVGQDVPAVPVITKFVTENGNMNVHLEWNDVTEGLHGYWYDPADVTYNVYRGFESNALVRIASDLKEPSYTDTEIGHFVENWQEGYFYAVTAENSSGETMSSADIIAVGKPYGLPCKESFDMGYLELNPWLTDPVSGSFSWSVINSSSGMEGHDNDNGLLMFYDPYGGWGLTDSRLISPVISLGDAENPQLSFWMYHWEESSVAYESSTRLIPEVRVNNGEWQPLCDPIQAATPEWGWREHRFGLERFKDADNIQIALLGETETGWMYFYVDQISIEDAPEHDLQLTEFYLDKDCDIDQTLLCRIDCYNHGTQRAEDFSIELIADGDVVWHTSVESLESGESCTLTASHKFNAAETGHHRLSARIVFAPDQNDSDNTSDPVDVNVRPSFYPTVEFLSGTIDDDGAVQLNWEAPALPDPSFTIVDGAEDYEPWIIDGIGQWMTVDRDESGSGYYLELPHKWPNCEMNQAFIVWTPDQEILDAIPTLRPYSGDKCFVSWLAVVSDFWNEPCNDDWLISPEVAGGSDLRFMVKGIGAMEENETFEVLYSTGTRSVDDFILLYAGVASPSWEEVKVTIPEEAKYFAIRYTAEFQSGLMVDDVEYHPVASQLKVEGYNVSRNSVQITDAPITETSLRDMTAEAGMNDYSVSVIYDRGSSNACDPINLLLSGIDSIQANGMKVTTGHGQLSVEIEVSSEVSVNGVDGKVWFAGMLEGKRVFSVPAGVYIVRVGSSTEKVIVD